MQWVWLTALGVGMATVLGAALGFLTGVLPHRFNDMVLGFAAGVMLCAAVLGLIVPAVEQGGRYGGVVAVLGLGLGALMLSLMDRFTPHLHRLVGLERAANREAHADASLNRVLLFVLAIALHNLPEGIAAGVSFGTGELLDALTVAGGIALQNIPEGMVIIAPLLAVGVSRGRTFAIAAATGVVEVIGTLLGYFAVSVVEGILPLALAFAGGAMLYVVSDEMIPETHSHGYERAATWALLGGFALMLLVDACLG